MPTLRIGLFGLRGAGKTVALSVAYLAENCDGLELTVRDEKTIRYLRPLAEALQRGEVPRPTMVAGPTTLTWSVRFGEANYDLETIDFAGELLDVIGQGDDPVAEQMMKQLRTQIREWFVSCDAVVLFIDSTDPGTSRYRDALVGLLDELSQRPTIRGSHQRAVVVVFTKGDQVARTPEQLYSPIETERILEGHPLYQIVQRRLKQHTEQIQFGVFLSSALGWRFLSIHDHSQRQVKPCNLFLALRWGLEQATQIVQGTHSQILDELNQELEERRSGPYFWMWALAHSRSLNSKLEGTDRDYQLTKGPSASQFAALRQRIQQARFNQLRALLAGAVGVFLLTLLGGWHHLRRDRITVYEDYQGLPRASKLDLQEAISYHEMRIAHRKTDWFWALGDRRRTADDRVNQDRQTLGRMCAEEAFTLWQSEDKNYQDAGRPAHRHRAAQAYLETYNVYAPESMATVVRQVRDDTQQAYDDELKTWDGIQALALRTPNECEHTIERLRQYQRRPDAFYPKEAQKLIHATSAKWYGLLAALPTGNRKECEDKSGQLQAYAARADAACRKEARQWLDIFSQGSNYLNEKLGERNPGVDYWELSTGFSLNLNPMFAFVGDKWRVRCKKSDPWGGTENVIPPSGKGAAATTEILEKLTELNKNSPIP